MRTTSLGLFSLLITLLIAVPSSAPAQQTGKVPRVCFLSGRAGIEVREEVFRQGLRELGYTEGKNIDVEWRFAKGNAEIFPGLATGLNQVKCDVIVAGGTEAAKAAKNTTTAVPIVFTVASDPVGAGLVGSLARPGANVTGMSLDAPGLGGKRLEILKETSPRLARSAVLFHPASPASKSFLAEIEQGARLLKVQIQSYGAENESEISEAFRAMTKERADGLVKLPSSLLTSLRKQIVELAAKHRLPAVYEDRIIVEDGGLMSYGPDITDLYRRSALLVDKILKGAKPADLPVEQPKKFEFIVNLKAAKRIGLTIPPNVLARADRVIR